MKAKKILSTLVLTVISISSCEQSSKAKKTVYGEVEVEEIDLSSRLPGRILKIHVKPGQKVKSGDLLIEFEGDILNARMNRAKADIEAAKSQSEIAEHAVRPEELEQLAAALSAAKKQMDFAKSTYSRMKILYRDGAIAKQQLEEVELKLYGATEQYKATLAKSKMAKIGARKEKKAGAKAIVNKAKTGLEEVKAYEKDLALTAPFDGEVFQVLNHEGELVPQGYPVVTLLRMQRPWVVIQIPETELSKFAMGKSIHIEIPALGVNTSGKVSFISSMASFASRVVTQDRSSFDLKTFEVRVSLNKPIAGLRPGMTAIVRDL